MFVFLLAKRGRSAAADDAGASLTRSQDERLARFVQQRREWEQWREHDETVGQVFYMRHLGGRRRTKRARSWPRSRSSRRAGGGGEEEERGRRGWGRRRRKRGRRRRVRERERRR
jgi:hypothetical protein